MNQLFQNQPIFVIPDILDSEDDNQTNKSSLNVFITDKEFTEENKEKLAAIVGSVGFDLEKNIKLIILEEGQTTRIWPQASNRHYICFGISPNKISLNLSETLYKWFRLEGTNVVFADSISTLKNDKQRKIALWNSLKSEFVKS